MRRDTRPQTQDYRLIRIITFLMGIFLLLVFSPLVSAGVNDGLIGHWKFDEGSGMIAADFSGNNRNGTLINNPGWVPGQSGSSLNFNGKDNYVDLGDIAEFEFSDTEAFSIALWLRASSTKPGNIFGRKTRYYWTWTLYVTDNFGSLGFGLQRNGPDMVPDFYKIDPGVWYHICVVVGAQNGNIRFYVNGEEQADKTIPRTVGQLSDYSFPFKIGGDYQYFDGTVDDVRIYNHELNPSDIQELATPSSHTIITAFGNGGTVSPAGTTIPNRVLVRNGHDAAFTVKANAEYVIKSVIVDGSPEAIPQDATTYSYIFNNVTEDHIIEARFVRDPTTGVPEGWRPVETYNRNNYKPLEKYNYYTVQAMAEAIRVEGASKRPEGQRLLWSGHPKVLIRPDNLEALREKIIDNQSFFELLQGAVDEVHSYYGETIPLIDPETGRSTNKPDPGFEILACGLIRHLGEIPGIDYHTHPDTGEPLTPADYGQEGVRHILTWRTWVHKYGGVVPGGDYTDHRSFLDFPLGYDWLYDLIPNDEGQRDDIAVRLLEMAQPDSDAVRPYNNHFGPRLLGAIVVHGDGVDDAKADGLLDYFYNGMVFGHQKEPLSGSSSCYSFIRTHLVVPEGPGSEGIGYALNYGYPFFPFLEAWYDQTGEDYYQMPYTQEFVFHWLHISGNENEHYDKWQNYKNKWWTSPRNRSLAMMFEAGLMRSNPTAAALAKYHQEEISQTFYGDRRIRYGVSSESLVYMTVLDPTLQAESPTELGLAKTAHFRMANSIFSRNSWENGIESAWAWFQSPVWTKVRDLGPINDFNIWKNGAMLLTKRTTRHDYDGGNRTNTMVLYDENIPDVTLIPHNVMDRSYNRSSRIGGPHAGLRYFEERPGEYTYALGDGAQTFHGYKINVDSGRGGATGDLLELENWSRQFIWFRTDNDSNPDHFVIFDRIERPTENITEHTLLNFNKNPQIRDRETNEDLGEGDVYNDIHGIWKYEGANRIVASNDVTTGWGTAHARAFTDTLLPKNPVYFRMGGLAERCIDLFGYKERGFDPNDDPEKPENVIAGMWRVQVTYPEDDTNLNHIYLHTIQADDITKEVPEPTTLLESDTLVGARTGNNIALFNPKEETITSAQLTMPDGINGTLRVLLCDLAPQAPYDVTLAGNLLKDDEPVSDAGTIYLGQIDIHEGESFSVSRSDINTPPEAATLLSPSSTITDTTPTYTWNAVLNATWYKLYVKDSGGTKVSQWYTAESAGCAQGTGSCSVTPTTELAQGRCRWWVKTYNDAGHGPWSNPLHFIVGTPPGKATLISPNDVISDTTPTYTWDAVQTASWYKLYVRDSEGTKINQWYTASEAGCAQGTGHCSVTPTTELAQGRGKWWIKTYNEASMGSWSKAMRFYLGSAPPKATLTSPSGTISDATPTYTWGAVSNSVWYKLWVNDSSGNRIQQWYRASAVCSGSTCSVTPSVVLNEGNCKWWIKTWNPAGSVWSDRLDFEVRP